MVGQNFGLSVRFGWARIVTLHLGAKCEGLGTRMLIFIDYWTDTQKRKEKDMNQNPNIQLEPTPKKKRAPSSNLEHKLQHQCVKGFSQKYPNLNGHLFAYFAETESKLDGGVKVGLGLVRGVSDLLYVKDGFLIGIEMKEPDTSHSVQHLREQADWLISVPFKGFFCDSIEMFWRIIETGTGGIDPRRVLENLKDVKSGSTSWEKAKK